MRMRFSKIKSIKKEKENVKVFNVQCEPENVYWAEGILVHNCCNRFMKNRMRSMKSIFEEIEFCKKRFNTKYFSFNDPSFVENKDFVVDFCDELLKRKTDIKWYCEARVDTPLEIVRLMAKAGCIALDWGMETASPKVLKSIAKGTDVSTFLPYAQLCHNLGIRNQIFVMVSLPDETEEDAQMTLKMVKKLLPYTYRISRGATQIFPQTALEKMAKNRGLFSKDFNWYDRNYDNKMPPEIASSKDLPIYIEHLNKKFIIEMLEKYTALNAKIALRSGDFWRSVKQVYSRSSRRGFLRRGIRILKNMV